MAFKIKDGIRIDTTNVFNNQGELLVNAPTSTKLETARSLTLSGSITSNSVNFDGSANIVLTTTIASDAVVLGTNTTGSYVQSISGGTGVTVTGGTGEGSTPVVSIGQAVGTNAEVSFSKVTADFVGDVFASNGTSKILENGSDGTDAAFTGKLIGNVFASNGTTLVLNSGDGATTPQFTGNAASADKWSTARTVTFDGTGSEVSGSFTIDGSANVSDIVLTVNANAVELGTQTTGNYVQSVSAGTSGAQTGSSGLTIAGTGEGAGVTIAHANTSTVSNLSSDNSGSTFIQDIFFEFDTYGHVTAASVVTGNVLTEQSEDFAQITVTDTDSGYTWSETGTVTAGDVGDEVKFVSGVGINIDADATAGAVRVSHANTSSQANVSNSNGTVIQGLGFDSFGHTTSVSSTNLDNRYYTKTQADNRYVNLTGDTLTGFLTLHADPTSGLHAATKNYVDEVAQGLQARGSADVLVDSNLAATYNNGTNGQGATLTSTTNGAFPTIDGVTLTETMSFVLVTGQTNGFENGLYVLTTVGNGSTPWVLTRCSVCDTSALIPGSFVFVTGGTTYAGSGWVAVVDDPGDFTIGVDDINWLQFSGAGTFQAGTGLDLTGTVFSLQQLGIEDLVDPNSDRILYWNNGSKKSDWLTANTGLEISGSNLNVTQRAFQNLSVAGQTTIAANTINDTLTLVNGSNVTITTNAGNKSITIASVDTTYPVISEANVVNASHTTASVITGARIAHAFNNIVAAEAAKVTNSVTFNSAGTGAASGTTFNGSAARTISYNTLGAVPATRTITLQTGNGLTGGSASAQDFGSNISYTFGLTGQALAVHNLGTNGLIARTSAGNVAARTIVGDSGITVTNGNAVSGNPSIAVDATVVRTTGTQSIADAKTFTGVITVSNTTDTAGAGTGALRVSGGAAVAKSLYVGEAIFDGVTHTQSRTASVDTINTVVVDTFSATLFRSARYLIQITQGGDHQVSEFRLIHNGTNTYITEYSVLETGGELGDFTADISSNTVQLKVNMGSSQSASIKMHRTLIAV